MRKENERIEARYPGARSYYKGTISRDHGTAPTTSSSRRSRRGEDRLDAAKIRRTSRGGHQGNKPGK